MIIQDKEKYKNLNLVLNDTFGKSSTTAKKSFQSVKFTVLTDDIMKVTYISVVNLGQENSARTMVSLFRKEGELKIEAALKKVKEDYKELTGKSITLSVETNTCQDSLEYLSMSFYNPKKTAYFRLHCLVKIS